MSWSLSTCISNLTSSGDSWTYTPASWAQAMIASAMTPLAPGHHHRGIVALFVGKGRGFALVILTTRHGAPQSLQDQARRPATARRARADQRKADQPKLHHRRGDRC